MHGALGVRTDHIVAAFCTAILVACSGPNVSRDAGDDATSPDGGCDATCAWGCVAGACNDALEVATSGGTSCVRRASGSVVCWGDNSEGATGDGTVDLTQRNPTLRPVAVQSLADAVEIAVGGGAAPCARRASGSIVCWGDNERAQLGDGLTSHPSCIPTFYCSATPVVVAGLTDAVEIAEGDYHACARRASGSVVCWGGNADGQLGDGSTTHTLTHRGDEDCSYMPVQVEGLSDAVEIAAGGAHTCARRASGSVVCWGDATFGELGDGVLTHAMCGSGDPIYSDCSFTPVAVTGLADAVEITAGQGHTCARRASGSVVCWGSNRAGQLGDGGGSTGMPACPLGACSRTPVVVTGIADAVQLAAGGAHTCARRAAGEVVCWGDDVSGELGDAFASGASSNVPVPVPALMDAVEIAAGGPDTCARRASNAVLCWGDNRSGQVGAGWASTGLVTSLGTPTLVVSP